MNSDPAVEQTKTVFINHITKTILPIPILMLMDLFAITMSLLIGYEIRSNILPAVFPSYFSAELLADTLQNMWWLSIILVSVMTYEELYQKRLPFWKETEKILKACTLGVTFNIILLYLTKTSYDMSRTLVLLTWLLTIILIPICRYFGKLALLKLQLWNKPVIIIGAGKTGELIVKALIREKTMGYQVVGFLDDNVEKAIQQIPILGKFEDAQQIIQNYNIQEVVIAAPGMQAKQLVNLTNRLQPLVKNVMLVPDLFGLAMNGIEIEYFFDEQALLLNIKNKLKSVTNRTIKRLFDICVGLILLAMSAPIFAVIAIAIKLNSKGPVFFLQERMGERDNKFTCYKFRTMHPDGDKLLANYLAENEQAKEEWQIYQKLRQYDPRITTVGAILRRFSLDELPQLINVITGEMSLVGPRPYLPREKDQMGDWLHDILVAKPGITGLWQVSGRNDIPFEGRLQLDVWYVRNWSLWIDIIMLIKTIGVVLGKKGAY